MAEEIRKVIHIDTTRSATSVKDLRDEIKSLRDTLVQLDSTSEQYVQIAQQVAQREQKLAQVMSASKNVITPYQRSLNALTATYSNQRQELRALRTALENLDPATAEYRAAFERAAEITHDLQERQELLRRSSSDLGVQLDNMRDIGTGLAAGWSSVNALMTLTGNNSEDLQKAMVKLQAGIALVQGMKGLEGLTKAVQGYINGASKWYDKIRDLIKGEKDLSKSIEANTVAENENAVASTSAGNAQGAQAVKTEILDKAQKKATTSAISLNAALKAIGVTLGIGVVIAAISGIISALSSLANASKRVKDQLVSDAKDRLTIEEWMDEEITKELERKYAKMEAEGKAQYEIEKERLADLDREWNRYLDLINAAGDAEEKFKKNWKHNKGDLTPLGLGKDIITGDEYKIMGKDIFEIGEQIKKMSETGNIYFAKMSKEAKQHFEDIKKDGIRTFSDAWWTISIFKGAITAEKDFFKNNTLKDLKESRKNQALEIAEEAANATKSNIQAEKDEYKKRKALLEEFGIDTTNLTKAHQKAIYSMITAETQSILDNAKSVNQTELQNLDDKYKKQMAILRKYGKDTTELEKAWQKQRAELLYKHDTDAFNNEDTQWKSGASRRRDYEFKLQSNEELLSAFGLPSEKAVQARLDYIHEETVGFLKEQERWWKEASENEQYTEDDRNKAYGEFIKAQNALTQENTEYYVKSAQNRMKALDREIENEKKQMQEKQTWQELNFNDNRLKRSGSSNAGQGLWQAFWGGDNPSYKQLQDEMDAQYAILKAGLDAQIALYKKAAYDKNLTDEERAAAKQKWLETEAELDVATAQHTQAVAENYKSMWETTLDAGLSVMDSFADILGSVADTMEAQVQRQLEWGQITEEQAEEQRKKIKAIQIAQTIVSTISGAIGAFTQASATIPPPAGQIVGGAAAAAVIAAGIASIAQMKSTEKNTNSISNSLPIASPSMAGFEKDYEANMTGNSEVSALRNALEGAELRAYVVESDITNAQNRSRRRSSESTF